MDNIIQTINFFKYIDINNDKNIKDLSHNEILNEFNKILKDDKIIKKYYKSNKIIEKKLRCQARIYHSGKYRCMDQCDKIKEKIKICNECKKKDDTLCKKCKRYNYCIKCNEDVSDKECKINIGKKCKNNNIYHNKKWEHFGNINQDIIDIDGGEVILKILIKKINNPKPSHIRDINGKMYLLQEYFIEQNKKLINRNNPMIEDNSSNSDIIENNSNNNQVHYYDTDIEESNNDEEEDIEDIDDIDELGNNIDIINLESEEEEDSIEGIKLSYTGKKYDISNIYFNMDDLENLQDVSIYDKNNRITFNTIKYKPLSTHKNIKNVSLFTKKSIKLNEFGYINNMTLELSNLNKTKIIGKFTFLE